MPKLTPISRRDFIKRLRKFGFEGPYAGGNHSYMVQNDVRLTIPNPHKSDIGVELLKRLLKQADISQDDWKEM